MFALLTKETEILSFPGKYIEFKDYIKVAKNMTNYLIDKVDIIIALTHLSIQDDILLAKQVPKINIILGGHVTFNLTLILINRNTYLSIKQLEAHLY